MDIMAYSDDFDVEHENGYRGDVFLDPSRPGETGCWIGRSSLSNNLVLALEKLREEKTPLDTLTFCYRTPEGQMFRKFKVKDSPMM